MTRILDDRLIGQSITLKNIPSTSGGSFDLAEYAGKSVVLFFYPKDMTSGCTQEAKDFRDLSEAFQSLNAWVFGISKDSLNSHQKFIESQQLNYPLLSDEGGSICESLGVWKEKSMYGKRYFGIERSTFVINPQGKVAAVWRKVGVPGHAQEVLNFIKS
jgi:peroxiredoxin Q/BCP